MWGFRFSRENSDSVLYLEEGEVCLRLYGRNLERVGAFRFLGVYFDTRLTWAEHIERVVGKCKNVSSYRHVGNMSKDRTQALGG